MPTEVILCWMSEWEMAALTRFSAYFCQSIAQTTLKLLWLWPLLRRSVLSIPRTVLYVNDFILCTSETGI